MSAVERWGTHLRGGKELSWNHVLFITTHNDHTKFPLLSSFSEPKISGSLLRHLAHRMKLSNTIIPLLVLVGAGATRKCTPGFYYCQKTLLKIGKSQHRFITTSNNSGLTSLQGQNQPFIDQCLGERNVTNANGNALFLCSDWGDGVVKFQKACEICIDRGAGKSDCCLNSN